MTDQRSAYREVTCERCGAVELRKGYPKYCVECAKRVDKERVAKKRPSKGVGYAHTNRITKPGKEGTKYFVGPPRPPAPPHEFVCLGCCKTLPLAQRARVSGAHGVNGWCAPCYAKNTKLISRRRRYVNDYDKQQTDYMVKFVKTHGG